MRIQPPQIQALGNDLGLYEEVVARYLHSLLGCLDPVLSENIFPQHLLKRAPEGYPMFVDSIHQQVKLVEDASGLSPSQSWAPDRRPKPDSPAYRQVVHEGEIDGGLHPELEGNTLPPDPSHLNFEDHINSWEIWHRQPTNRRAFIIAETGYGKSMLLQITAIRGALLALERLRQGAQLSEIELPILISFTELADSISGLPEEDAVRWPTIKTGKDIPAESVVEALSVAGSKRVSELRAKEMLRDVIRQQLLAEKCCVLIDSWDECRDPKSRDVLRKGFEAWMPEKEQTNRVYATSRICGQEGVRYLFNQVVRLEGFSRSDAQAYIQAWFPSHQDQLANLLCVQIDAGEEPITSFAKVPLLCCFMCKIVMKDGRVPETRADLLEKTLLGLTGEWLQETKRERHADLARPPLRSLALCAFWMSQSKGEVEFKATRSIWEETLQDALIVSEEERMNRRGTKLPETRVAELLAKSNTLLDFWSKDCGILIGKSREDNVAGLMSPYHKSLFDYLSAQAIADCYHPNEERWGQIKVNINGSYQDIPLKTLLEKLSWRLDWQETLPLTIGIIAQRGQDASPILRMWLDEKTDDDLRTRYLLVVKCILELSKKARTVNGHQAVEKELYTYYRSLIHALKPGFKHRQIRDRYSSDTYLWPYCLTIGIGIIRGGRWGFIAASIIYFSLYEIYRRFIKLTFLGNALNPILEFPLNFLSGKDAKVDSALAEISEKSPVLFDLSQGHMLRRELFGFVFDAKTLKPKRSSLGWLLPRNRPPSVDVSAFGRSLILGPYSWGVRLKWHKYLYQDWSGFLGVADIRTTNYGVTLLNLLIQENISQHSISQILSLRLKAFPWESDEASDHWGTDLDRFLLTICKSSNGEGLMEGVENHYQMMSEVIPQVFEEGFSEIRSRKASQEYQANEAKKWARFAQKPSRAEDYSGYLKSKITSKPLEESQLELIEAISILSIEPSWKMMFDSVPKDNFEDEIARQNSYYGSHIQIVLEQYGPIVVCKDMVAALSNNLEIDLKFKHLAFYHLEAEVSTHEYLNYLILKLPEISRRKKRYCLTRLLLKENTKSLNIFIEELEEAVSHGIDRDRPKFLSSLRILQELGPNAYRKSLVEALTKRFSSRTEMLEVAKTLWAVCGDFGRLNDDVLCGVYQYFSSCCKEDPLPYMRPLTENPAVMDKIKRWMKPRDARKYPQCRLVLESTSHHSLYFSRDGKFYTRDELSDLNHVPPNKKRVPQ